MKLRRLMTLGGWMLGAAWALGCGPEVDVAPGLDEPLRAAESTFRPGPLPGADVPTPEEAEGPRVTALEAPGGVGGQGQRRRVVTGRVSAETYAVAMALEEAGRGYWVRPVDAPDPANGGERTFRFEFDLSDDAPVGRQRLRFVALDGAGVAGAQRALRLCITPPIPDNLNACDPRIAPPAFVVELTWEATADLDLRVLAPEGRWASAQHPTTRALAEDETEPPPDVGVFSGDAGADCAESGPRREILTFQEEPAPGAYLVYARLFDACGLDGVPFRATLWTRASSDDGTWSQTAFTTRVGVARRDEATAEAVGTYLFSLDLTRR